MEPMQYRSIPREAIIDGSTANWKHHAHITATNGDVSTTIISIEAARAIGAAVGMVEPQRAEAADR